MANKMMIFFKVYTADEVMFSVGFGGSPGAHVDVFSVHSEGAC